MVKLVYPVQLRCGGYNKVKETHPNMVVTISGTCKGMGKHLET
jgi:hypothetical protein